LQYASHATGEVVGRAVRQKLHYLTEIEKGLKNVWLCVVSSAAMYALSEQLKAIITEY